MAILLPRLSGPAADRILEDFLERSPRAWRGFDPEDLPDPVRFAATGGSRVTPVQLAELRGGIVHIACKRGFRKKNRKKKLARFDSDLSGWLVENQILAGGEALRDDVWTFISVAMAPDVVYWRFGSARERYLGGVRNTFQRLWMRAMSLDRGQAGPERWKLVRELTEDALVQLTERPSIGADSVLAREIAEAWLRAATRYGKERMEPIMRRAVLRVRVQNEVRRMSYIPHELLVEILDNIFDIAARDLSTP